MLLNIKVIPNASKPRICPLNNFSSPLAGEDKGEGAFKVYVKAPPVDGKANKELVEALAEHFKVKKNRVEIIRGATSRTKVVKIM